MLGINGGRFRFFTLLVALVAVVSLAPVLLAQDANVRCPDGRLVNTAEECLTTSDDGNGEAMESSTESADFWPSRWGADDQAGASNWITASKVMEAANLIQTGEIYELGQQYTHGMPLFGNRTYSLTIPGAPTGGPFPGGLVYHDEFIVGELGQVGTQFDGLGHVGYIHNGVETFYNGFTEDQIMGGYGLQKLGVENISPSLPGES